MISLTFINPLFPFNTAVDTFSPYKLSSVIELIPGKKRDVNQCFSVCHWNLNSIASHSFSKILSLIAYNSIHKFDIICLSESYSNSEILSNDSNLQIPVIILFGLIILQIRNAEVCVCTTNVHCH